MCSDRQFKNTNSHFQCLEVDIFVPKIYCWNYEEKSYNVSEYFSFMPKTIPSSRVLETQNPETQNPEPRASELQMPFSYGVLNILLKIQIMLDYGLPNLILTTSNLYAISHSHIHMRGLKKLWAYQESCWGWGPLHWPRSRCCPWARSGAGSPPGRCLKLSEIGLVKARQ